MECDITFVGQLTTIYLPIAFIGTVVWVVGRSLITAWFEGQLDYSMSVIEARQQKGGE